MLANISSRCNVAAPFHSNLKAGFDWLIFRVRGKVKKLLGDEEGALNDLTVAELLDYDTTVRTCSSWCEL